MSANRRARRAKKSNAAKESKLALAEEQTATCIGMWREINAGWRTVKLELPRSVVEKYAVDVSEPELKQVAVAKVARVFERLET